MNGTPSLKGSWGWLLALGVIYVIMGLIMAGSPIAATYAIEVFLGFILIAGGAISVIGSFFAGNWKKLLLILLSGILYLVVGYMLLKNPMAGVLTLTILLAAFLLVEGIFKIIHAFQMKPSPNWVWLLVSGIASVILGVMIWGEFPASSAFVIGLLVGIYFIINGFSMVMLSFALKGK
ncbi:MAG: HdeD family acid-resistance protein [Deltaproteobacteria bacterium]